MPSHLPLSGRRYLIPLVQAASLSAGASGCFGGALLGEWTLVEVDGKDADLFSDAAAGGHSVEPQPYGYYGHYGYTQPYSEAGYESYEPTGRPLAEAARTIPVPQRSPSEGSSGAQESENCDQKLGLELSLDIDERDGEDYEGEAEGGVLHTLVCDGRIESREIRRRDGDVEAEDEGKGTGRYTVEVDVGPLQLELDCEVDGSELQCEADDTNIKLDELRFRRGD
jgi:hypothetical protein